MNALPSTVALSDFRAHASTIFEEVAKGGRTMRVLRHGKPVADIVPPNKLSEAAAQPHWKRSIEPLKASTGSLAQAVISEREQARY